MFVLLSRVLLWLLVGTLLFTLFQRFYPSGNFVGRLILAILLIVVLLSFVNPNEPAVASLWNVVSFPLKPLGAVVLLLMFAAQRIKGGGTIDAPGGFLLGWALTILLLASTPAVAYFLVRSPIAMVGDPSIASLDVQNWRLASSTATAAPTSGKLVALAQETPMVGDSIIYSSRRSDMLPPFLLQTPQDIPRRGLRLEDFVPNAETLELTTRVWESYLNQIYIFLRGT